MVQFATRLEKDGSPRVPQSALDDLGLHPGDTVQVSLDAAPEARLQDQDKVGQTRLDQAVRAMTCRTPEQIAAAQQHAMVAYMPKRTVPPGKTLAEEVSGQWPGHEAGLLI